MTISVFHHSIFIFNYQLSTVNLKKALVIESTGSRYKLLSGAGEMFDSRLRGRMRLSDSRATNPVAVGDEVTYEDTADGETVITGVEPRRNYIIRRASNLSKESHIIAANIDQAFIVATLFSPRTSTEFIDRFLVTCEAYHIPASIILNKSDLAEQEPEMVAEFLKTYRLAGYPVIEVSAANGVGVEGLELLMKDKTSLLSGNSGVGKSTLIKAIEPSAEVRIGKISDYHHKGTHTTTFARMYPLSFGGYIIDTPGIKGFGLIDIADNELAHYFPDFMRYAPQCQYYNCTHTHEPGCAVTEALRRGELSLSRYESYLKILDEDGKYRT